MLSPSSCHHSVFCIYHTYIYTTHWELCVLQPATIEAEQREKEFPMHSVKMIIKWGGGHCGGTFSALLFYLFILYLLIIMWVLCKWQNGAFYPIRSLLMALWKQRIYLIRFCFLCGILALIWAVSHTDNVEKSVMCSAQENLCGQNNLIGFKQQ